MVYKDSLGILGSGIKPRRLEFAIPNGWIINKDLRVLWVFLNVGFVGFVKYRRMGERRG